MQWTAWESRAKVFPIHSTKAYKGSRGIAPLIPEVIVPYYDCPYTNKVGI